MAIDTLGANALASNSVTSAKIVDGAVVAADVADGSVTTAKLADDAVTAAKIDDDGTGFTLGDLTVDTSTLKVDASNNRVGIGTTSPQKELHIKADNPGGKIRVEMGQTGVANNDVTGEIEFYQNDSSGAGVQSNIKAICTNSTGAGALLFGTGSTSATTRQRIQADGTIGYGSIAANNINSTVSFTATGNGSHSDHFWTFGCHYTADNPSFYTINESGTGVYLPTGNTSWSAHSDERIKENITPLSNVLPDIKNMRCVKYNLKGNSDTKIGFIAQDWETKFSEVVDENSRQVIESDGSVSFDTHSESTTKVKAMSYTETIPVLLKAIQELSAEVEKLKG